MKRLIPFAAVLVLAGCGTATKVVNQAPAPGHPAPDVGIREAGTARGTPPPARGLCGVERWSVKVLSDPSAGNVNPQAVPTTIAQLDALRVPPSPTDRVQGLETTTYKLTNVRLDAFKVEADSDIHLAISDGPARMIAEIPDPKCMHGAAPAVVKAVAGVRARFVAKFGQPTDRYQTVGSRVSLTGVAFGDRIHGQRGVGPRGLELHPVLAGP